jgi:hypothetical protein
MFEDWNLNDNRQKDERCVGSNFKMVRTTRQRIVNSQSITHLVQLIVGLRFSEPF